MINVYERISKWLVECPIFDGYLYFNVIPVENGNSSLNSNSSSTIITNFLDGSKEIQLYFTINVVKEYDDGGTSDLNLDAINSFSEIISWIFYLPTLLFWYRPLICYYATKSLTHLRLFAMPLIATPRNVKITCCNMVYD